MPDYASAVTKAMRGEPVVLVAVGIAVINGVGDILLLQRHDGEWDLPGGHMEPGESLEGAAKRELLEEAGLTVDALELLGVASGRDAFHRERNAYYVTAIYRATTADRVLNLSLEHADGAFFALGTLPDMLSTSAQRVTAKLKPNGGQVRR